MRSGAGCVTLGVPKGLRQAIIKIKPKEAMVISLPETREGTLSLLGYSHIRKCLKDISILIIGPGITQNKSTQRLARKAISEINKPMVIDADGLNALAGSLHLLRSADAKAKADRILTPHPGEMARLLAMDTDKVQRKRLYLARKFARDHKITLVLKGHGTIVTDYKNNLYINKTGNPGMATAGSGDVLTGMIAGFLAQGLGAFEASKYAVYLHGLAGDLAAGEKTQLGMIASDIIGKIPEAIKMCS